MPSHPTRRDIIIGTAATTALAAASAVLPSTTMAQPAKIRRDVNQLAPNDPILEAYRRAVTEMRRLTTEEPNNPLGWTKQATIHNQFCPHANWFFLPWHRAYLAYLEDVCRKLSGDDSFALPYWDWTRNPQIPAPFWGTGNSLNHPRTATPQSTLRSEFVGPEVLDRIMRKLDFEGFGSLRSTLEARPKSYF